MMDLEGLVAVGTGQMRRDAFRHSINALAENRAELRIHFPVLTPQHMEGFPVTAISCLLIQNRLLRQFPQSCLALCKLETCNGSVLMIRSAEQCVVSRTGLVPVTKFN